MSRDPFSPRKSGRQSRARETIEAILQASRRIISQGGVTRLTTNHVAELAGVSIGSLYQYFPGKDAVLHAVMEREFNRAVDAFITRIEAIDPEAVPLDEAIARIVDVVFDAQLQSRPLYRQLILAALSFKHLHFTLDNDARVLAALRAKLLRYGAEVDREGIELALFVVLYAFKGVQLGTLLTDRASDDRALRALLVRLARACITPDQAAPQG